MYHEFHTKSLQPTLWKKICHELLHTSEITNHKKITQSTNHFLKTALDLSYLELVTTGINSIVSTKKQIYKGETS